MVFKLPSTKVQASLLNQLISSMPSTPQQHSTKTVVSCLSIRSISADVLKTDQFVYLSDSLGFGFKSRELADIADVNETRDLL